MFSNDDQHDIPETQYDRALLLQNILIKVAENGSLNEPIYKQLRQDFMNSDAKAHLPKIITTCYDYRGVWAYLKQIASGSGSWDVRRSHIRGEFTSLLAYLENNNSAPSDSSTSEILSLFNAEEIHAAWEKALIRRHEDPEGAITASRTLLEAVCKHILDEASVNHSNDDLPKLYKKTSEVLNLAPSQHTEQAFKAILGGCHTIVQNLGTLRNQIGDAHAQGKNAVRPAPRHAALAVNLAGIMATFLIETWNARNEQDHNNE
jgi:hypothetical protein